jgi:hypothetical protein
VNFNETFSQFAQESIPGAVGAGFYVQDKTASDGSVRSMALLDPRTAGLSYSTLGMWTQDLPAPNATSHTGTFVAGALTRGSDIPTTGSATYSGLMTGIYADQRTLQTRTLYAVGATANALADFGSRVVTLNTTGTQKVDINALTPTPMADPGLDVSARFGYPAGRNVLTSTSFRTSSARMPTGFSTAHFFGPAAAELGGTFFVRNGSAAGNTEQMSGGFVLKKQ